MLRKRKFVRQRSSNYLLVEAERASLCVIVKLIILSGKIEEIAIFLKKIDANMADSHSIHEYLSLKIYTITFNTTKEGIAYVH